MGAGDIAISEAIKLSPPLVLTVCLLYIMASDGKIQEQESSQLQQVIGGNDGLLAHALAYVKAFPVEKFLEDAPSVLSQKDKLCIMANLYDSMLADGNADKREHEIFNKFREAFDSVHHGHGHIQQDDIGLLALGDLETLGAIAGKDHLNIVPREGFIDEGVDHSTVIHA